MTQSLISTQSLYDRDFLKWTEATIVHLQNRDFKCVSLCFPQGVYQQCLKKLRPEYKNTHFPDTWQFTQSLDDLLNRDFWG